MEILIRYGISAVFSVLRANSLSAKERCKTVPSHPDRMTSVFF